MQLPSELSAPNDNKTHTTSVCGRKELEYHFSTHEKHLMFTLTSQVNKNFYPNPTILLKQSRLHNLSIFHSRTAPSMFPPNSCHQTQYKYAAVSFIFADPGGRTFQRVGQRLLDCSSCLFESRREHGYLSVLSVVCCQAEFSSKSRFLVQRRPTECLCMYVCVSVCV